MADRSAMGELPMKRFDVMPRGAAMAIPVLIALGLIALVVGLMVDAERAWRAYLFNWLFFSSVAMGGVMFAVVVSITRGLWSRSVRRISLSFVAFLPLSYLLLIPLLFAADHLFPWLHETLPPGKENWLNVPFLAARNLVALGALYATAFMFAYWSLRPDIGRVRDQQNGKLRGLYDRLTRDWQGQEVEEARAYRKLTVLGPVMVLLYALAFSVVAWDFVMSLEHHWFSTLIGPYFFMAALLGGIAATGVLVTTYTRALNIEDLIAPSQFHDLGKLTFGFCIFWAYLLYSQYIVIWYGQLPGEQAFLIHRFSPPFTPLAQAVFACLFVLPFFGLLGVAPKRNPVILSTFGVIILLGLWLERMLLVYPTFYTGAHALPFGWAEIGIALVFAGLMLLALMTFATRFPLFQLWHPMSELELEGIRVEDPAAARSIH